MARIAGINIPDTKHARVSLTYIFGIGATTALKICDAAGVRPDEKIGELDEASARVVLGGCGGRRPIAVLQLLLRLLLVRLLRLLCTRLRVRVRRLLRPG